MQLKAENLSAAICFVPEQLIQPKALYKEMTVKIPAPSFVLLYNDERYMPAYHEMKLSDAYMDQDGECSLQLSIKVYNINKDAGSELLEKCPL